MRLIPRSMICGSLAIAVTAGCASRGNVELLEAHLRHQEDELRSLHTQATRTQAELVASRRLNESLNQRLVQQAGHEAALDVSEQHFRVTGLKINSLLTGAFDRDEQPGDDQVTLVFAPHDDRDQSVQLPGTVECKLMDTSRPDEQQQIGHWSFDASETRAAWLKLLGSSGYRLELPWQTPPSSSDLELRVHFRSEHGDSFDASCPVKITLADDVSSGAGRGQNVQ